MSVYIPHSSHDLSACTLVVEMDYGVDEIIDLLIVLSPLECIWLYKYFLILTTIACSGGMYLVYMNWRLCVTIFVGM